MTWDPRRNKTWVRIAGVVLALLAIAYLVRVVPIRDQCVDSGTGARGVPEERPGACLLHGSAADVLVPAPGGCRSLKCEPGIASVLKTARPPLLAVSFLLYLFGVMLTVERWKILLKLARVTVSLRAAIRLTFDSYAIGFLLPGGMGADALRVAFVLGKHKDASVVQVTASVVVDRLVGFGTMCTIASALAFSGHGGELGSVRYVFLVGPPLAVVGAMALRYTPILRWMNRGILRRVVGPLDEYARAPGGIGVLVRASLLGFVASGAQLLAVAMIVWVLGTPPVDAAWVWIGVVFGFIATTLPGLPGGWGTSDATYVYFFGKAGVPPSTALAVSLLVRFFGYALSAAGAVSVLAARRAKPEERERV